ncbi:hypothetical protein ABK040_002346 [Willaertia magna]
MNNFLLSDVAEFHILSYLDLSSILAISCLSRNYNAFVNESQIIWENKIINYFNEGTNYDANLTKEMTFYYSKLNIPFLLGNNEILQRNNFNYKDLFYLVHYLFAFSKKGYSQSETIKSFASTFYPILDSKTWNKYNNIENDYITENGTINSIVGYFNGNHTVMACHKYPGGNWETIVANKECKVGNIYYWTIHLTRYTPQTASNAWAILIGVDDILNYNRTEGGLHYWLSSQSSNGFGYCIKTDDYIDPSHTCRYAEFDLNVACDYIGVCFDYRNIKDAKITFYINNGENVREYNMNLEKPILFRPAVSIVGSQAVSILPWDGNINLLKEMKKFKDEESATLTLMAYKKNFNKNHQKFL